MHVGYRMATQLVGRSKILGDHLSPLFTVPVNKNFTIFNCEVSARDFPFEI